MTTTQANKVKRIFYEFRNINYSIKYIDKILNSIETYMYYDINMCLKHFTKFLFKKDQLILKHRKIVNILNKMNVKHKNILIYYYYKRLKTNVITQLLGVSERTFYRYKSASEREFLKYYENCQDRKIKQIRFI